MINLENLTVADRHVETTSISHQEALDFIFGEAADKQNEIDTLIDNLNDKEDELENAKYTIRSLINRIEEIESELLGIKSLLAGICGDPI